MGAVVRRDELRATTCAGHRRRKRFLKSLTSDFSGRYPGVVSTPGTRRRGPTIYDVARLAGVSTATVSRALNGTGQVAASKRFAIEAAVERLGYRPNTIARSLVTRSTQTIALLLPDITNPFYAELVTGIQ